MKRTEPPTILSSINSEKVYKITQWTIVMTLFVLRKKCKFNKKGISVWIYRPYKSWRLGGKQLVMFLPNIYRLLAILKNSNYNQEALCCKNNCLWNFFCVLIATLTCLIHSVQHELSCYFPNTIIPFKQTTVYSVACNFCSERNYAFVSMFPISNVIEIFCSSEINSVQLVINTYTARVSSSGIKLS